MNPAIDVFIAVDKYLPNAVNRTIEQDVQPNGKGVNISFVLKMLGIDSTAIGFSAGFTGSFIETELEKKGITADFIEVEGITRLNIFTRVYSEQTEYKLVNPGPAVPKESVARLLDKIASFTQGDTLCVSGSNPVGVPADIIVEIAKIANHNGVRLVLDSSSKAVINTLAYKPYIIKPNIDELAAWMGKSSLTDSEAIEYGKKLAESVEHVLISLGANGAYYINKTTVLHANAPDGEVVNTACSGDTMLGSFLAHIINKKTAAEALSFAVSAGSATAFCKGLTDFSDVDELMKQVTVQNI
jgi:1-phosphofructokinase